MTLNHPACVRVEALSDRTLLDFEAVIVNADGVRDEIGGGGRSTRLDVSESRAVDDHLSRRAKQLNQFLELGRPIIAFCCANTFIQTAQGIPDIDLGPYLPGTGNGFHPGAGDNIVFQGPEPYMTFAQRLEGRLRFVATLDPCPGRPLFYLKGTKEVLGAVCSDGKKWLLLCPKVKPQVSSLTKDSNGYVFVDAALDLFRQRPIAGTEFVAPEWQSSFVLSLEKPLLSRRVAERKILAEAEEKLLATEKSLQGFDELKRAFTAKGDVLVNAVATLLRMLGIAVEPGPEVKDDLIAKGHDLVFVVEVKGRDRTGAAEKDARQLESWVSRYAAEHDTEPEPKGLLVVNGYKDLPPHERKESTYPHAMLDYVKRKKQCALTGMQLLCLALEAQQHKNESDIARELAATVGVFARYNGTDWQAQVSAPLGNEGDQAAK